jgi:hypothetical protein
MVANKSIDAGGGQKPAGTGATRTGATPHAVTGDAVAEASADVELILADLVGDEDGETVFFNDSGFRTLAIETSCALVANGRVGRHVTAGGANVTGFQYVTFDNGLTLYYEEGLDLILPGQEPVAS